MITIRQFADEHLPAVLALIERSDSTNRSITTWKSNNMTAVLAFDADRLIGVLPFEKRSFSLGQGKSLNVLWTSAAHVEPMYRSQGIGTTMMQKMQEYFYPEHEAVCVYRGDESSGAYKWYKQLGCEELQSILSFKKEVTPGRKETEFVLIKTEEEFQQWGEKLHACFSLLEGAGGGFVQRTSSFWAHRRNAHYYKEFYSYFIIALRGNNELSGYAFIGQTAMKDNLPRLDILEFIAPTASAVKDDLLNAIINFAHKNGLSEVRIQLSTQDPHLPWVRSSGFVHRWRFSMLGKIIDPINYFTRCLSERIDLHKDYQFIIETPGLGRHPVGNGKNYLELFSSDSLLQEILFCRCNIAAALEEGNLAVIAGNEESADILIKTFPLEKWKFFQIDYV